MNNHSGAKDGCNSHINLTEVGLVTQAIDCLGFNPPSTFQFLRPMRDLQLRMD
jgi:hypothetical protein